MHFKNTNEYNEVHSELKKLSEQIRSISEVQNHNVNSVSQALEFQEHLIEEQGYVLDNFEITRIRHNEIIKQQGDLIKLLQKQMQNLTEEVAALKK